MTLPKWVRDKVPDRIRSNGGVPVCRVISPDEAMEWILRKLAEEQGELSEAVASGSQERILAESADFAEVFEVFLGLVQISPSQLTAARIQKVLSHGTFGGMTLLEAIKER